MFSVSAGYVTLTGDSITAGTIVGGVNNDEGYDNEFESLVASSPLVGSSTTIGRGGLDAGCYMAVNSGCTINYAQDVVNTNPDTIVFMLGTNDSASVPPSNPYLFSVYQSEIGTKTNSAFNLFETTSANVFVLSILPVDDAVTSGVWPDWNSRIDYYNDWLEAEANGRPGFTFVDVNAAASANPNWVTTTVDPVNGLLHPDGYHLSQNGQDWLAVQVFDAITDAPEPLIVNGTSGADVIDVTETATHIEVSINGTVTSYPNSCVTEVQVLAGAGNDTVRHLGGSTIPVEFRGGGGNDTLVGNDGHEDFFGEGGDDTLRGNGGNDKLRGGNGNDNIYGGTGGDDLFGDDGDDDLRGNEGNDMIIGGKGNDTIRGNAGADTLKGFADDDVIYGGGGTDIIQGGSGDDHLFGEAGDDTISGNGGSDILVGGIGDDILKGSSGKNLLIGGSGVDELISSPSADVLVSAATTQDSNIPALDSILVEWKSSNTYANRVKNIYDGTGGGGANGSNQLSLIIIPDTDTDTLKGRGGRDYFWGALFEIDDLESNELFDDI